MCLGGQPIGSRDNVGPVTVTDNIERERDDRLGLEGAGCRECERPCDL